MTRIDKEPGFFLFFEDTNDLKFVNNHFLNNCFQTENITVCRDEFIHSDVSIDMCVYSSFLNQSSFNNSCIFKSIRFDNYLIQTSVNEIYFALIKPIVIRFYCENNAENVMTLVSSKEITINDECFLNLVQNSMQDIIQKNKKMRLVKIDSSNIKIDNDIQIFIQKDFI